MNATHLHLMLNHLPVVGMLLAVMVGLYAWRFGSREVRRLALGIVAAAGGMALPAYLTGSRAERAEPQRSPVERALLREHEEAAGIAFLLAELTGIAALGALFGAYRSPQWLDRGFAVAIAGAAVTSASMAYTAHLGGQIAHPETRGGTPHIDASPVGADEEISSVP